LPEDPRTPAVLADSDTFFHAGHVTAPWSIYVADPVAEVRLTTPSQTTPQTAVTVQLSRNTVRIHWFGNDKGEFRIGGRAVSLTAAPTLALRLHYRVDTAPRQRVVLSMRCEAPPGDPANSMPFIAAASVKRCGIEGDGGADLTNAFRSASNSAWTTLTVPLRCLVHTMGAPNLVAAPLAIESSGEFVVSLDDIRWVRDPATSACPQ
jgi:hypothetical protein